MLLVAMPGAPSSVLAPTRVPLIIIILVVESLGFHACPSRVPWRSRRDDPGIVPLATIC